MAGVYAEVSFGAPYALKQVRVFKTLETQVS